MRPALQPSLPAFGLAALLACGGGGSGSPVPVPTPDFRLQAPAVAAVTAGQGTDFALGVERLNGFSASLDVTVAGLPAGSPTSA